MSLAVTCSGCGANYRNVPAKFSGRSIRCKKCGTAVPVPVSDDADPWDVGEIEATPAPLPSAGGRPSKPSPKRTSGTPPWVWAVAGGVGLLLVGGVVALIWSSGGDEPPVTASTTSPPPDPPTPVAQPVSNPAASPTPQNLPVWASDPALTDRLGDPIIDPLVGRYEFRPPKGYSFTQGPAPPPAPNVTAKFGIWVGDVRPDGTRPMVQINVLDATPDMLAGQDESALLRRFLSNRRRDFPAFEHGPIELGRIGDLTVARASWTGDKGPAKMRGLWHVAKIGSTVLQLNTQDVEPHHEEPLKVAEASLLTIRQATATAIAPPPATAASAGPPAWEPDPALLDQLGEEIEEPITRKFRFRLPKGYTQAADQTMTPRAGITVRFVVWTGPPRPSDGRHPGILVNVTDVPLSEREGRTPDDIFSEMLRGFAANFTNFDHRPIEAGRIADVPFHRAYWSGIQNGAKTHGVWYVRMEGPTNVVFSAQHTEPDHQPMLDLAETALKTLRRTKNGPE